MPPTPFLSPGYQFWTVEVLDRGAVERHQLDDRRVELVLVALGCRAALEVAHRCAVLAHDQRPLELPRVLGVDAEVGGQLHRALHALRHEDEAAVAEHRRVERGEEVVGVGHDRAEILPHQLGMILHRLRERAEDDAQLRQLLAEGRRHRHRVEHRVDGDAGQHLLFDQRDAELVEGGPDLRDPLRPCCRASSSPSAPRSRRSPGSRPCHR